MSNITEDQLTELIDQHYRAYASPAGEEYHRQCIRAIAETVSEPFTDGLTVLQQRLEQRCSLSFQDGQWWLFDWQGEGAASGVTIDDLVRNLSSERSAEL